MLINTKTVKIKCIAFCILSFFLLGCRAEKKDNSVEILLLLALANSSTNSCANSDVFVTKASQDISIYYSSIPPGKKFTVCGDWTNSNTIGIASQAILTLPTNGTYKANLYGKSSSSKCGNSTIYSSTGVKISPKGSFSGYTYGTYPYENIALFSAAPDKLTTEINFTGTANQDIIVEGLSSSGGYYCLGGGGSGGSIFWKAEITSP